MQFSPKKTLQIHRRRLGVYAHQHNGSTHPGQRGHNLCAGRATADLKHQVCARALGPILCVRDEIGCQGVHNRKAQCLGFCQPEGIHFGDHHLGAIQSGGHGDEHPNRPAANDNRTVAQCHFCAPNIVYRHGQGFDQRARVVIQGVGHAVQAMDRRIPKRLKRARGIDPQKIQILTDVPMPPPAGRTRAASHRGFNHHAVAHGERGIFCSLHNFAAHLVPHHQRNLHALIHVALINMQIRAAQARPRHFDEHFASRGPRDVDVAQFNALGSQINRCFHHASKVF